MQNMNDLVPSMNDAKWRRLLNAIEHITLPKSYWSFLNDDSEYERPTPKPDEIISDNAIGDTSVIGPFHFRDVRTVRWPFHYQTNLGRNEPTTVESQAINELIAAIRATGQFDITITETDLTLTAYRTIG